MDNEKIVTVLLLITIILSVLSVVVVLGNDASGKVREVYTKETITGDSEQSGSINLAIVSPPSGGAG